MMDTKAASNQAAQSVPPLSTAIVDITLAAHERAFALNMSAMQEMLSTAAQGSEDVASGSTVAVAAAQPVQSSTFTPLPVAEPMFRYVAQMLQIYQGAAAAIAELLTAQTRGEQQQVEALTAAARAEASEAASTAVTAVGSVVTTGIEVTNRLATVGAQAGQSLIAQAADQVAPQSDDAERGAAREPDARRARRSVNGRGKHA